MNNKLIAAMAACSVLAIPALALAEGAMQAENAMPKQAMMATMMCRPAMAKEHGMAMMMDDKKPLVCKTMHPEMMLKGKGGPDLSKALSAAQVDAAWRNYVNSMITITSGDGGG